MNINISDFFKNNTTNNSDMVNSAQFQSLAKVNNQSSALNMLLSGDTFTGLVSSIKGNEATVILSDGSKINAHILDGVKINQGQVMTFLVEENSPEKISIKPMYADEQQSMLINKVLDQAGLAPTVKNINMVKELVRLNMPVDTKNISDMSKLMAKYSDTDINTLANLKRLDIPVTESNIAEFKAYKTFDNQISNTLTAFESDIVSLLSEKSDNSSFIPTFEEIFNKLYEGFGPGNTSKNIGDIVSDKMINELTEFINKSGEVEVKPETVKNFSVKELMGMLIETGKTFNDTKNVLEFFKGDSFKNILHEMFNETVKLTPASVKDNTDSIGSFYKRIKKSIDDISEIIKKDSTLIESSLNKNVNNIKNSIDFMNDLNKNLTFVQIPIKFSESEGNGELYVFTNKKNNQNTSDSVSALLHLDMENLGSMDVFVKLSNKNVSTNFVLETEELLDFVYSHIDKLNKRLEEMGYNTHFEMKLKNQEENEFDFVRDFVEKDVKTINNGQFLFDIKA